MCVMLIHTTSSLANQKVNKNSFDWFHITISRKCSRIAIAWLSWYRDDHVNVAILLSDCELKRINWFELFDTWKNNTYKWHKTFSGMSQNRAMIGITLYHESRCRESRYVNQIAIWRSQRRYRDIDYSPIWCWSGCGADDRTMDYSRLLHALAAVALWV